MIIFITQPLHTSAIMITHFISVLFLFIKVNVSTCSNRKNNDVKRLNNSDKCLELDMQLFAFLYFSVLFFHFESGTKFFAINGYSRPYLHLLYQLYQTSTVYLDGTRECADC